jgi:hypothetical protein
MHTLISTSQARLRAEYDRMEDKLREMEDQMRAREAAEAANRPSGKGGEGEGGLEPELSSGTVAFRMDSKKYKLQEAQVFGWTAKIRQACKAGFER